MDEGETVTKVEAALREQLDELERRVVRLKAEIKSKALWAEQVEARLKAIEDGRS